MLHSRPQHLCGTKRFLLESYLYNVYGHLEKFARNNATMLFLWFLPDPQAPTDLSRISQGLAYKKLHELLCHMSPCQVYLGIAGVYHGYSTQNPRALGVYPESQLKGLYEEYKL